MSDQKKNPIESLSSWYRKNETMVNRVLIGILVVIVGIFAYKKFIIDPKNEKANNAIYLAEQFFMDGNFEMALQGQGSSAPGFLTIMKKYSGTPQANLSKFYAGVSYLQLGEFQKSIDMLKDFKGNGSLLEYRAYGCIGDAYAELGKNEDAIKYYKKASSNEDDVTNAPVYMLREGLLLEKQGKAEEAKKVYLAIRRDYPTSQAGSEIDKYLARVGEVNNY